MRFGSRLGYAVALGVTCVLAAAGPAVAQTRYVALGDSLGAGASAAPGSGYVDRIYAALKQDDPGLELSNRSVGGENSRTLRANIAPNGPGSGQLDKALADIADAATDTTVVTIDIGGNDGAIGCGAGVWHSCEFGANFAATLDDLNLALAADPGIESLLVMTYYNPAVGLPAQQGYDAGLIGTDGKIDCSGSGAQLGLNDRIACLGAERGAVVADVYPAFCSGGQSYMAPDGIHANTLGHAAIAQTFGAPPPLTSSPCSVAPPPAGNTAPLCSSLVVVVAPGATVPVQGECVDAEDDSFSFALDANASHGVLAGAPPNVTYTPAAGFTGVDSIAFHVTDEHGAAGPSATTTFLVGDPSGNQPPACPSRVFRLDQGSSVELQSQCVDVDGDALFHELVSGVAHGSLDILTGESVRYTPAPSFAGRDSFSFRARDGAGEYSQPATATFVVVGDGGPNAAPTCPDVELAVVKDGVLPLPGRCSDPDGDQLTYELVTPPSAGGSVLPPADGGVAVYRPPAGFTGVDSFTYRTRDPGGLTSAVAQVRILVVADEGTLTTFPAGGGTLATGTDASPEQPLVVSLTSPLAGTAAILVQPQATEAPPPNYVFLGSQVEIVAPDAPLATPLEISFRVPAAGVEIGSLTIFRNGQPVPRCSSDAASAPDPDPCMRTPETVGDDVRVTVLTTRASTWNVAHRIRAVLGRPLEASVANVVKGGRVVPVKVELFAGIAEIRTGSLTLGPAVRRSGCDELATDLVEEYAPVGTANEGDAFRRDADGDVWIYNLTTAPLEAGACYRVPVLYERERVGSFVLDVR